MKTKIGILVLALCTSFFNVQAQRRVYTTTRATSYDISDNLDLDAVSSIFGESRDLEDFEYRLNDPDNRISNLDLNEDGYVDYLRVIETTNDRNSLVVIQAVLDRDVYQDVANIEIERLNNGTPRIQVVGDAWIYGPDYIIEPVFVRTPLIFSFFWGPRYVAWQSPYYWGYYPRWYHYYRPYSVSKYHKHVYVHVDRYNTYNRINERHFHVSGDVYNSVHRGDYAKRYPNRAFENRNHEVRNRNELIQRRSDRSGYGLPNNSGNRPNSRIRQDNRNMAPEQYDRNRSNSENRRPVYQNKSGQVQPREYNRRQEQKRTETYERRSEPQSRPSVNQERSSQRVETPQRSSAPRERSGSVQQSRSRSNNEVRQNSRSVQKSESPKKEQKKESRERRREE